MSWRGKTIAATVGAIAFFFSLFAWYASAVPHEDKPAKPEGGIGGRLAQLQLDAATKELIQAQTELRKEQVQLAFLKANEKAIFETSIPDATIDEALKKDPAIEKLRQELTEMAENLEKTRKTAAEGKAAPALREIQKQMANLEINLEARRKSLLPKIIEQMRTKDRQDFQAKIAEHDVHIAFLKEYEKALLADMQRYAAEK
jgi:hypothetical protein